MPNLTAAERRAIEQFKTGAASLLGDNLVSLRLFGSRGRNQGTEESDLDVLVIVRHKTPQLCRRVVEVALDCDLAHDTNLAPTILTVDEYKHNQEYQTPFYLNVEREGQAI